jgi:WhiB family redox-sensing transcriptional regulator
MILTYTAVVPRWQRQAACRGRDVEAWYPEKRKTVAEEVSAAMRVKRVCVACAVRVECLELAFDMGDPWGVGGGATPGERAAVAVAPTGSRCCSPGSSARSGRFTSGNRCRRSRRS